MNYQREISLLLKESKVVMPKRMPIKSLPKINHPEKAVRAINFIQTLCSHTKGRWAGADFLLIPWQFVLIWRIFGTCKPNGKRQYRIIYVEIPKKNGKSELAAAIALICLVADDEAGGEVYSAAADKEQAGLVYQVAAQMVRQQPVLEERLKIVDSTKRIIDYKYNSFYKVLSAESFTKHGINPSAIIFDEIHAQPKRDLWDVLVEGTDYAREQQLVFGITTAGIYDKESIGWELHEQADQISRGIIKDPSFLPVMYCADKKKERLDNPKVWKRLNPSIGYIFDMAKIKADYDVVKNNPARLNNFYRFRLNVWVNQITRWIDMDQWDACKAEIDKGVLLGRECFGALDLSSTTDLSALAFIFPPIAENEKWRALINCYVPEETIIRRSKEDRVPYNLWRDAGYITATPGNVIDYSFIRKDVNKYNKIFKIQELAYDPWGAVKLAVELQEQDDIPMVEHRQGYKSMSPSSKEFEKLVIANEIEYDGNPVLRWCVDNLVVTMDAAENIKPAKDKARERIDAAVAVIMAVGRAIIHFDESSIYNKRGMRKL